MYFYYWINTSFYIFILFGFFCVWVGIGIHKKIGTEFLNRVPIQTHKF
nr:MAG TPA: transmembrane protein [Caudoviricetes sp.]